MNGTGAGTRVYVADTGILLTHEQFGGRAVRGFDAVTAGGTALDCNGPGTHVAGNHGDTLTRTRAHALVPAHGRESIATHKPSRELPRVAACGVNLVNL